MTPAEWVKPRAEEWAQWRERAAAGEGQPRQVKYGLATMVGSSTSEDFAWFDERRCVEFNAQVNALAEGHRVVFWMHWLGARMITVDTSAAVKAGHCGISLRGYYRRLEEAYLQIYNALR